MKEQGATVCGEEIEENAAGWFPAGGGTTPALETVPKVKPASPVAVLDDAASIA